MKIFCHRGKFGCTDINQAFLQQDDVKENALKTLAPENSEESIKAAFNSGFCAEIDVTMTKDKHLIVTHTNSLYMHSINAKKDDFVSNKTLSEIEGLTTGIGGRCCDFLTYDRLMILFSNYLDLYLNVEIKGTIQANGFIVEPQNPSLVEKLAEQTPTQLIPRIIWSSFATSNLIKIKKLIPQAKTAQLFSLDNEDMIKIYPNTDDKYLKLSINNLENVLEKAKISAIHPPIKAVNSDIAEFCLKNNLAIRTWEFEERNPAKNKDAFDAIANILNIKRTYPKLDIDIITDYADSVFNIIS